ncbi:hypothetical protein B296_00029021, partial [Ensete ventricosum]
SVSQVAMAADSAGGAATRVVDVDGLAKAGRGGRDSVSQVAMAAGSAEVSQVAMAADPAEGAATRLASVVAGAEKSNAPP